eukprot:8296063-Pyramimonas_sp.AAC.2
MVTWGEITAAWGEIMAAGDKVIAPLCSRRKVIFEQEEIAKELYILQSGHVMVSTELTLAAGSEEGSDPRNGTNAKKTHTITEKVRSSFHFLGSTTSPFRIQPQEGPVANFVRRTPLR